MIINFYKCGEDKHGYIDFWLENSLKYMIQIELLNGRQFLGEFSFCLITILFVLCRHSSNFSTYTQRN